MPQLVISANGQQRLPIVGNNPCRCSVLPFRYAAPLDTTPEIEAMQIRILRSMTIEQRLQNALEISLLCREFMRAGVRNQYPDWSDKQIEREVHRRAFSPQPLPDWVG